jgi:large subunit ribosomal protein L35
MPKMKTNSSAKKRFSVTGTGKIKRKQAFKSHILTKKSTKGKRALTKSGLVHKRDLNNIKFLLAM